jgi:predicted Zn-dependent peptidase
MINIEPSVFLLDNGMRVVYLHDPAVVAHLGVTVLAGSRFEKDNEVGLAHFLEHCIFKGTTNRRAFHILSRLDSVGGELNAYTTKEEIAIYGSFTKEHFNRTSELLADITFNSTFPEKEIQKEKAVIIDEINSYLDSPGDKIFDDYEAHLFQGSPLGNNILGTIESVQSFQREDLLNYVNRLFHPENMVISFVGNIPSKRVLSRLNKDFGAIRGNKKREEPSCPILNEPFTIASAEANYQSHIMLGGYAPGYADIGRRAFTLLINILGGPALNSRLVLSIREKYGYTYNIEANYTAYKDVGYWFVYAGADPKYKNKIIQLIKKELRRFIRTEMTPNQLKRAKEQLKGHLALGMDSNVGLMLNFGKSLLIFDRIDTLIEIHDQIDGITSKDIQKMAEHYFDEEKCSLLAFDVK